jgi:hypothetical protein
LQRGSAVSLPPTYQPLSDDEEDRKRKAQIEDMMRSQRESYFRNEPVQQEYRDVITRLLGRKEAQGEATEAKRDDTPKADIEIVKNGPGNAAADQPAKPAEDLPAWFRPYANPSIDLGRGETPQISPDIWSGKSSIDPNVIARPATSPVFDPEDIAHLERYPETAPSFDKKYRVSGSSKRALDELASWLREVERRGDNIRDQGNNDPLLPRESPKATASNMFRLMHDADKSLDLPRTPLENEADPYRGKPLEALPVEAVARANSRYYRDQARSRQDIPAALDRTEGTFGADSKFYKQALKRREEEARKELGKRFADVAYKLTREEKEKVDPLGVYADDISWAIVNEMTHPVEALVGRAAGLPGWAGGLVAKYAPNAAKAAGSIFRGPAGKAVKEGGAYATSAATGGAVGDGVEQGLRKITGEQDEYSATDTLKAARDGVVEDAVKDAGKASAEAAAELWWRNLLHFRK